MSRLVMLLVVGLVPVLSWAAEPSYFRRDSGLATGNHALPERFDGGDAKLLWRSPQKPGNSTPCLVGDLLVFTTFDAESRQLATVALDAATGKTRWRAVSAAVDWVTIEGVGVACGWSICRARFGVMLRMDVEGKESLAS